MLASLLFCGSKTEVWEHQVKHGHDDTKISRYLSYAII